MPSSAFLRPRLWRTPLLWICGGMAVIVLACGFLYLREATVLDQTLKERETNRVAVFIRIFSHDMAAVAADARFLAGGETLRSYLADPSPSHRSQLADEMLLFLRQELVYDDLRYLDETGRERLRVNRKNGIRAAAPDAETAATRQFVPPGINLRDGDIYLTPLELETENGRIVQPPKPILRFVVPVMDAQGRRRGSLVLTYLGERLFERFAEIQPTVQERLRVLNAQGYWLRGPEPDQDWGFQIPERSRFTLARSDPSLWQAVSEHDSGQRPGRGGLFTWERLPLSAIVNRDPIPAGDPYLVIAAEMSRADRNDAFAGLRRTYAWSVGVLTCFIVGMGCFAYLQSRERAHRRVSDHLNATILRAANVAIISLDPGGTIRTVNPTAERWLGRTAAELVGRETPAIFHDPAELVARAQALGTELGREVRPGVEALTAKAADGVFDEGEWTYLRRDGSRLPVWLSTAPLRGRENSVTGFLCVATDITASKKAELALREARIAAEASNRLKAQFLANMSHEIRTPMNGVVGMIGLLLDTPLDVEQRRLADTARASAESLLTILNDILDFSKIEAGQLVFEHARFDLRDPVEHCLSVLLERAQSKGLKLTHQVAGDVPVQLIGDAGRLQQVLLNLVGNAVKFTERGEVSVRVTREALEPGKVRLRFAVRDTGIGISPEAQARLFEPFVQADSSTTRKYGGTGLGLAISRQLAHLMGGEMGIESALDLGSIFWFTAVFPLPDGPADGVAPAGRTIRAGVPASGSLSPLPEASPGADASRLRVLVAEDNRVNQQVALMQLGRLGYKPDLVTNGLEAVVAVQTHRYDVVLMDCLMPELDGYEATRRIRAWEALRRAQGESFVALHIIAMTANAMVGDREACLAAGMDDYISKPMRPAALAAALSQAPTIRS